MTASNPFELADMLSRRGVTYAIIGGHAVNFHGYIRSTEDIDIVFLRTASSEIALFESLAESKGFWISDEIDMAWLKRLKIAANRPQDRIDLEKLP